MTLSNSVAASIKLCVMMNELSVTADYVKKMYTLVDIPKSWLSKVDKPTRRPVTSEKFAAVTSLLILLPVLLTWILCHPYCLED